VDRRSTFSAARAGAALAVLGRGAGVMAAARAARVTNGTLGHWIKKGLAGQEPFVAFALEAERLKAETVERALWSRAQRLFELLRQGRSLTAARLAAGIDIKRWQRWLRLGEASTQPIAEFVRQLREVQARTQRCRKLTPERMQLLIGLARQGLRRWQAVGRAGITKDTMVQWMKWGREGRQPYAELAAGVEAAEANVQQCRVLTPAKVEKLLAALAQGKSGQAACRAAGLGAHIFYKCMKAGRAGKVPLAAFAARVQAARRVAERRRMNRAWDHLRRESWRTAARRLTARDPENWSLRRVRARALREIESQ
jgi:transposase-like protein